MAGENSKSSGEKGEAIIRSFYKCVGWNNVERSADLRCSKRHKHARPDSKKGERESHGVDGHYVYSCPLERDTAELVVISVKHTDGKYPKDASGSFKVYAEELSSAMECYEHSDECNEFLAEIPSYRATKTTGVIFWVSEENDKMDSVLSSLQNLRFTTEVEFRAIHLMDNRRIDFLTNALNAAKSKFDGMIYEFYYPSTSLNYGSKRNQRTGPALPVNFFTAPSIPMVFKDPSSASRGRDVFVLILDQEVDGSDLKEAMRAALDYSSGISCEFSFWVNGRSGIDFDAEVKRLSRSADFEEALKGVRVEINDVYSDFRTV